MRLCGGCGLAGTRENHWNPPEHKCPRWNTEYEALRDIASLVEAAYDPEGSGDTINVNHIVRAVARWREIYERTTQLDYEKVMKDYTCTVCGKLDPTSPGKCQKCTVPN
jgi:hypothetical protein